MQILGIDIGGTSIKAGVVNTVTGAIIGEKLRIPTPQPCTREALLGALGDIVAEFKHTGPVGMGFPGVIQSGAIATAANIGEPLVGMRLGEELQKKTGLSFVTLVNDADAAGLGEAAVGGIPASSGMVIVLTLGTGIGGALIYHGKLVPNFEPSRFLVPNPLQPGTNIDAEDLLSAINREKLGLSWEFWAKHFNDYLDNIYAILWPEQFVLGGGGAYNADKFMHLLKARCPIHIARLGNDAGIVGAALAAR
jgi:polyphosphate glucokinase